MNHQVMGGDKGNPHKIPDMVPGEMKSPEDRVTAVGGFAVVFGALASVCCLGPLILGA